MAFKHRALSFFNVKVTLLLMVLFCALSRDDDEVNVGVLARSYRFLGRVVRAAVPIQAMMLLLLGVSSIVPLDQDELICSVQNNLQRSFEPMLRWSNGPPPI